MTYFSVEEMAQMLRRSEETIRRQIRSHQINAKKVGRSWQISEEEIMRHQDAIEQSIKTFQKIAPQGDLAIQKAKEALLTKPSLPVLQSPQQVGVQGDTNYYDDPAVMLAIAVSQAKQARNKLAEVTANGKMNALDYRRQIFPPIKALQEFAADMEEIGNQLSK